MEIILKQDVQNLGHKDDIVKVRNGLQNIFLMQLLSENCFPAKICAKAKEKHLYGFRL